MKSKDNPTIFVGSSKEGIKYAEAIENFYFNESFEIQPWYRLFNEPLVVNIEHLENFANFDFAILILTPDDITEYRGNHYTTTRDNLIFELGLLIGYIGRNRVFPIKPEEIDIKLPTDLLGTNPLPFHFSKYFKNSVEFEKAVSFACRRIKDEIQRLGRKAPLVGENINSYKSSIRFHDNIIFDKEKKRLKFRIAYNGVGSLLDVNFHAYFHHIQKTQSSKIYSRDWDELKLSKQYIPEVELAWTFFHHLEKDSPIYKILKTDGTVDLEDLREINGKIAIYVKGKDSIDMTDQYNNKKYNSDKIETGNFNNFYTVNEHGEIILKSWDDFNKIE